MTISEKLLVIDDIKTDLKTSIEEIGVDLSASTFSDYSTDLDTGLNAIDADLTTLLGEDIASGDLWTPAEITTSLWLDSSDLTTITKDGSDLITAWNDKSGNARHAAATVSPLHYYDNILEKWVIRFDGTDDFMTFDGTFLINTDYSMFIVARRSSNKATNYMIGGSSTTASANLHFGWNGDTLLTVSHYTGGFETGCPLFTTAINTLFSRIYDSSDHMTNIFENGVNNINKTITALTAFTTPYIGRYLTNYFEGDIMEIIITNTKVDELTRQKIEGYLANKWDIVLTKHPYNTRVPRIIGA